MIALSKNYNFTQTTYTSGFRGGIYKSEALKKKHGAENRAIEDDVRRTKIRDPS